MASYDRIQPSNFSCEQDSNLMGSDFDNEESGVSGIKRDWAVIYVFKSTTVTIFSSPVQLLCVLVVHPAVIL